MNKDNKKKLLFVVEAMGGGVFTYIVELANTLIEKYDIYIAYAVRPQTPPYYQECFDHRIHLIKVKNFIRSISFSKDIRAFFEIKKIADEVKPDIIHLHSSKAGVLGRWAFAGRKTAVFYTPHGYSFLMEDQSAVKRFVYKTIERVSAKRPCTTISCSEGEHRETLKLTNRAAYVDNGINIDELEKMLPSIPKRDDHPFTVFTIGRICDQKNPTLFNEIAEALPEYHFLWIGDGERRERVTSSNVEITGWLDRKTALSKAMTADVFILPSLWEGLPISLLEAMYMKIPCVVSDVIGNHDVIHNGENGYVCNGIAEFMVAIEEIRAGKSAGLVEKAYEDILNRYNTTAMAEKYSALYDKAFAKQIVGVGV